MTEKTCTWTQETDTWDDDNFITNCGHDYVFLDYDPEVFDAHKFCPFCGGRIEPKFDDEMTT